MWILNIMFASMIKPKSKRSGILIPKMKIMSLLNEKPIKKIDNQNALLDQVQNYKNCNMSWVKFLLTMTPNPSFCFYNHHYQNITSDNLENQILWEDLLPNWERTFHIEITSLFPKRKKLSFEEEGLILLRTMTNGRRYAR